MAANYDVIVIGARCAGAPTAMLLARRGLRVLLVDRATFPSDTISTHLIHPPGIDALRRWGLLDDLVNTGCPPIRRYRFDFEFAVLDGRPSNQDGFVSAYAPRRTVLDNLLVTGAADAGVEVRPGYKVDEILTDDGRVVGIRGHSAGRKNSQIDRAPLVVGADGRHSLVASTMGVKAYKQAPPSTAGYYTYFSGLPIDDYRVWVRHDRAVVVTPTNDDLRMVLVGWPRTQYAANKLDLTGKYHQALANIPEIADHLGTATSTGRLVGTGDMLNAFRRPYGPGFALVGDAAYVKDPCTAQGITDAFRDAELLTKAVTATFNGYSSFDTAMASYHFTRDKSVKEMYKLTQQFASLRPMPAFMQAVFKAMQMNHREMDRFASVMAGTASVKSVFNPLSLAAILLSAKAQSVRQSRSTVRSPEYCRSELSGPTTRRNGGGH